MFVRRKKEKLINGVELLATGLITFIFSLFCAIHVLYDIAGSYDYRPNTLQKHPLTFFKKPVKLGLMEVRKIFSAFDNYIC
jgi:hypothetical protein